MTIRIEFHADPGSFVRRLCDLSALGACLLFPLREPVVPALFGSLSIRHPTFDGPIRLRASSLGSERLPSSSFVWVRVLENIDFGHAFGGFG